MHESVVLATLTRTRYSRLRLCHLVLLPFVILGCAAVGPDYVTPAVTVPGAWSSDLAAGIQLGQTELQKWWTQFGDPTLSELIERAAQGNLDLRAAVSRIDEARAELGVVSGSRYPRVDSTASYTRSRQSEESGIDGGTFGNQATGKEIDTYVARLGVGWEFDLFGRVRRSIQASKANWEAAAEDYHGITVALCAEIAGVYVNIRELQRRVAIAGENLTSQRKSLNLVRTKRAAGIAPALDLSQAEANVASTEARLPQLHAQLRLAINRLSVLLGEHPGTLPSEMGSPGAIPSPPEKILIGIPADLMRQRPDIRRAERLLAAQTARIGIQTAELYPRISLSGFFGFSAQNPGDLIQARSRAFAFGPSLAWNIFAGGSIRSAIEVEDARAHQALIAYEQTVLRALEDVEAALANYEYERQRNSSLRRAVTAYRQSVIFAEDLYDGGKSDFQNVLDAQRNLLTFEDQLAESDAARSSHLIALYRAMGGGWETQQNAQEPSKETTKD